MTDAAYRLAADSVVKSQAARTVAAMVHQFRDRVGQMKVHVQALSARAQVLGRLNYGIGLATLPLALMRSAPYRREEIAGPPTRHGISALSQPQSRSPVVGPNRLTGLAPLASRIAEARTNPAMVAAGLASRAVSAGRAEVGRTILANVRSASPLPPLHGQSLAIGLVRSGAGAAAIAGARAAGGSSLPFGEFLAATPRGLNDTLHRAVTSLVPSSSAPALRHIATTSPQQSAAPGFNRTVRQQSSKSAAGDVYLDKALVGYHLAAAITGEQTRAAGRPSSSATGFNSRMAVLRPSGAGL